MRNIFTLITYKRLATKKLKTLRRSFLKNIAGVIWGSVFTFFISLTLWCFAYFGYTDLGLPVRYDYEILNKEIKKELPLRYSYTINRVKFRDSISESLLVVGRDKNWTSITDKNIGSDILLILDKADKKYTVSFKFEPDMQNEFSAPVFTVSLVNEDIDSDGDEELAIGWSYLGASFSPPYVTVFDSSDEKNVSFYSIPRIMHYKYRQDYPVAKMSNAYDKSQSIIVNEAHSMFAKKGELMVLVRNDKACNACSEDQVFELHKFYLNSGRLQEHTWNDVQSVKSFNAVKTELSKQKYDMSLFD